MGRYVFKLSDVGEGIAECEIATWRVAVGDVVTEDQPLVDMLTEKAAVELPSPVAGKIIELHGEAGDMIAVGSPLVVLEVEGAGNAKDEPPKNEPQKKISSPPAGGRGQGEGGGGAAAVSVPASAAAPAARPSPPAPLPQAGEGSSSVRRPGEKPVAAPAVRQRARDLGIDLRLVAGSGPAGRITHADLDSYVEGAGRVAASTQAAPRTGVEDIKIIGLRRRIAEAMQRAKQRIPHFAYVEELDVTELEALRIHLNETRRPEQAKLTLLPFLLRALVQVLPRFPQVNATYDDEAGVLRRYAAVHCGVATQTPNGLVVPVLRHAETLDVWQMASEIRRLAEAARSGKATREELSGSSITISSLGALGGIVSTPVINAPEVAIVGVNKLVERAVFRNGVVVPRLTMNLSSSFDHRIVDGYDAAQFIQAVKQRLEHPATLFMTEAV
ncbi:dihydrolipoamide acetyltransferase family protein [Sinimarinibacterium flocculans]|uniref:Dihydrolipoamide acetyltransferase component of pyruvate dehydrogenase complex n=1 Tax=Sinimarinibacterium flocculans TaxID=985250 RepID=A0A318EC80_9GAMM|nr:dihydrolipoamide acetyltransferase family protein [Sinimarinibacterium flocculans]PXV65214.1 branched-chain alpha-keto acid dehydrogenase E2 component [Sinimarinibacterium flocculans]